MGVNPPNKYQEFNQINIYQIEEEYRQPSLLSEDGGHILNEDGGRIILE